jgi:hypothetical protein
MRPFEEVELDKTGDFFQMGIARQPDLLERILRTPADAKPIHRDEHPAVSSLNAVQVARD